MPEGVGYGPKDPIFSRQPQATRVPTEKAGFIQDSSGNRGVANKSDRVEAVSYTHLTLPTIYSV